MNKIIDVINKRVSLRKYADREISKEHLDTIINSAMRAPTAGNMMLYTMLVIKDKDKKKKLSKTCDNQPFIANAPVVLVFLADMQRWFDYYDHCNVKGYCENHDLGYNGPQESDLLLAASDAIIAAQNAVIAAESLDIGSCYIGDIIENYEIHKEMLNLPDWAFPVAMLCLGYYPEEISRTPRSRFDREYIVFDEEYKRLSKEDFNNMYKNTEKKISKDNKFQAENFGQMMYARKTGSDFSKEMARSVKVALKNWDGRKL
ncbi:nitroreductase family protein [Sporosalibacterium faouarense]|uniref:nitroreductase family protein n=1 Tax=Sporosalibacterium faouarense TaxID=516123 RepID=UPI00141C4B0F|nr:nitroreductase family protein [Sporosalibacterium faouarense]MTI49085.1 nitroreductase [Bacillota bacterium]